MRVIGRLLTWGGATTCFGLVSVFIGVVLFSLTTTRGESMELVPLVILTGGAVIAVVGATTVAIATVLRSVVE